MKFDVCISFEHAFTGLTSVGSVVPDAGLIQ